MGNLVEYGVLCGSPLQMLGQSITQVHQPLLDVSQNTGRVSDTLKNEFAGSIIVISIYIYIFVIFYNITHNFV